MVAGVRRPRLVLRRAGAGSGTALKGLRVELPDGLRRIRRWGEARDWCGYDPYDALNSPFEPLLTLGRPLGRRVLTQAVKRSPINLRPALRIEPTWNAKALALVASAYARLFAADSSDEPAREQTRRWLGWLVEHRMGAASALGL